MVLDGAGRLVHRISPARAYLPRLVPGLRPTFAVRALERLLELRWLWNRPGLAALLGLVGGPLAWWAGDRLGALDLVAPGFSLCVIGLGWAALMPILLALAAWCDTVPPAQAGG